MGVIKLLMLAVVLHISFCGIGGRPISEEEDLEFERQLKILNKPPVKTFQMKEGDIVDCIDFYQQPAFDNLLLKNHKFKMQPHAYPKGSSYGRMSPQSSNTSTQSSLKNVLTYIDCPDGTVPIRRTSKEDLIRAKAFSEKFNAGRLHSLIAIAPDQRYAVVESYSDGTYPLPYYGIQAKVKVDKPSALNDQFSSSQLWLEAGPPGNIHSIQAGWAVAPSLFGDEHTRSFLYYSTGDKALSGCFNFLCPGFVQVHQHYMMGSVIRDISQYRGDQYFLELGISQKNENLSWVLTLYGEEVAFWTYDLVPNFTQGATYIAWGGLTRSGTSGSYPPMGNGYFPNKEFDKASAHWNLHYINNQHISVEPRDSTEFNNYAPTRQCYNLDNQGYQGDRGFTFLFGGPGGNCS